MTTRHLIYKLQLNMKDGIESFIFIATRFPDHIPLIVEKNKMWWEKNGQKITNWKIIEQIPTIQMPISKYEEEISFCDVVDELDDISEENIYVVRKEIEEMESQRIKDSVNGETHTLAPSTVATSAAYRSLLRIEKP